MNKYVLAILDAAHRRLRVERRRRQDVAPALVTEYRLAWTTRNGIRYGTWSISPMSSVTIAALKAEMVPYWIEARVVDA